MIIHNNWWIEVVFDILHDVIIEIDEYWGDECIDKSYCIGLDIKDRSNWHIFLNTSYGDSIGDGQWQQKQLLFNIYYHCYHQLLFNLNEWMNEYYGQQTNINDGDNAGNISHDDKTGIIKNTLIIMDINSCCSMHIMIGYNLWNDRMLKIDD